MPGSSLVRPGSSSIGSSLIAAWSLGQRLLPRWRLAAVLKSVGVVGCLLLQLSAVAHQVLVRHSRCVEHGELVHSAALAQGIGHSARDVNDARPRFERSAESGPESHEHCAAVFEQRRTLAATPAEVLHVAESASPVALALLNGPDAGREVYDFAPKTSPPQRA
jgi:hypothetical protein